MRGSALGDAVGISWLLRDVDGERLVGHGGTTYGQYSDFTMVPAKGFAVTSMTNCGPNGSQLNQELTRWALEHYAGVRDTTPEPLVVGDDALSVYAGRYETIAIVHEVTVESGRLIFTSWEKSDVSGADEKDTVVVALTPGDDDPFVVAEGPARNRRGYFTRDAGGGVDGVNFGGRHAGRVSAQPASV
jgi:hypothetical protein